ADMRVGDRRITGRVRATQATEAAGFDQERLPSRDRQDRWCTGWDYRPARSTSWCLRDDLVRDARLGQNRAKGRLSTLHPHHADERLWHLVFSARAEHARSGAVCLCSSGACRRRHGPTRLPRLTDLQFQRMINMALVASGVALMLK